MGFDTVEWLKNSYTDQEGVVWDWDYAICPECHTNLGKEDYFPTSMTSFKCPNIHCALMIDEPAWSDCESAFMTCISDEEAANDPDPEIRRRYREYHALDTTI